MGLSAPQRALPAGVRSRLERHLKEWLGTWPPDRELVVTTAGGRARPGWDGRIQTVLGIASPEGTVLSVPDDVLPDAQALAATGGLEALARHLPPLVGRAGASFGSGVFRWSVQPAPLPDAGEWLPVEDPRLAGWLRPFGAEALVALREGVFAAAVGIKRHDPFGHELAVGTEEGYRGRGLARRLVAQAARRVIAEGAVPTYLHDPGNAASAKVAEAAGFPDRGWKVLGIWP